MNIGKVVAALNSGLRREILKIVSGEPATVIEVLEELKRRRLQIKYRETVYRALEKLFDAGLVEKYYVKQKGLCYRLSVTNLTIDLARGTLVSKSGI